MAYMICDICENEDYNVGNPFVEIRVPRPSDPSDMCCIMAGHDECFGGGNMTPDQWSDWIESPEAAAAGYYWLT